MKTSKARRWTEGILLLAGLIAVGIWGWSHARMAVFQSRANQVLDHEISRRSASVSPRQAQAPLHIQNGALIGRLAIPRLHMRAVVREGAGQDTLDVALGHIPGTALPGQPGNAGIAGHRDTLFRGLRHIEKNDLIEFQTPAANYDYQVESTSIVKPDDVAVLHASQRPEMTLVTCYPFYYVGSAPDRFIVKARLVDPPVSPPGSQPSHAEPSHNREGVAPGDRSASHGWTPVHAVQKANFQVNTLHSRELAPGIVLRVAWTDPARRRASGWLWIARERRTIWLWNKTVHEPVFFRASADSRQRELLITSVTKNSVSGYLSSMQ